ncbi:MAG: acetoin dehydrogenase dihydrolipoyllysine-residue acetyltransferase subunit [Hyphomicrobiales bacterium]
MAAIKAIIMPKWGLAMQEGMVAKWNVKAGDSVRPGQEIMDIETSKIANVFESPVDGPLRRVVAGEGETVPVGALLGVVADQSIDDAAIDAFVDEFKARFASQGGPEAAPEPQTVEVSGKPVRYLEIGGGGTAMLLIHGFGSDHTSWAMNQAALAGDRRVVAPDLPGHGASSKDVGGGDIAALSATVLAFMEKLGLARAHLVGHSLGAGIALNIAQTHPARAASLTMIAPCGLGSEINMEFIGGFIAETRARKLKGVLEMLTPTPAMISSEMVENVIRFKRLDGAEAALRAIAAAAYPGGAQGWSGRDGLARLAMPAQAIFGAEDRIIPPRHAADLPAAIKALVIAGAGHVPHMEKPQAVNAAIEALAGS